MPKRSSEGQSRTRNAVRRGERNMKTLYRYEIEYRNDDGDTNIRLREFPVVRETEKTYFIAESDHVIAHILGRKERKVRKDAIRTYAYDTKEKAKEHFIRRTHDRIRWFHFWIQECEKGLELIKGEI